MITEFDNATYKFLAKEINEALAAIGAKHGVSMTVGRGKLAQTGVLTMTVDAVVVKDTGGPVPTKDGEEFRRYAELLGFKESDLHRKFRFGGEIYRLEGADMRKRKYPMIGSKGANRYKFTEAQVLANLI